MRVLQSKFTKTNPQKIQTGGARPARRSWIRLCMIQISLEIMKVNQADLEEKTNCVI